MRSKRHTAYIISVADGGLVLDYIIHASSRAEAEREAREGAHRWGTTVIDVRSADPGVDAGRTRTSCRARAYIATAGATTIGLVATTVAIAAKLGGAF